MTLDQTADYLQFASIEQTIDAGFALVNIGRTEAGQRFVMVNDMRGDTAVTESL
ncbi:hypothetical protein [Nevskia ramosa]|uniref:hypothetical protein n=1 Tax=Nevskia ramosa TaxID=64002 RepID=UPI0012EB90DF|nr:hypothetical protein [Nevskia ramosa]